jgi:uncharacterized protein (TIGR03435 family)
MIRWLPPTLSSFRTLLLLVVSCSAFAQPNAQAMADAPSFSYDVVSIRPHPPDGSTNWRWGTTADGFSGTNVTVRTLIISAYSLRIQDQLAGLPKWANTEAFDMQAKMDDDASAGYHKLSRNEANKQDHLMLQKVLADRFQLKVHHEVKDLPIYYLEVSKDGPKLKDAGIGAQGGSTWSSKKFTSDRTEIIGLANALSINLSRIVVDKTGLTGQYAINLHWTPDDKEETTDSGPSLFAAIEEQLGLKLVAAKGPVDTVVVDKVEEPSEN